MKNAFIVLLVLLPLLQACNLGQDKVQPKQEQAVAEEESSSVEVISATEWQSRFASVAVEDGILQFESSADFHTLLEQFSFLSEEEQSRVIQRSDFTSYRVKYAEVISSLKKATDKQTVRSILVQHPHIVKVVDETIRPTLGDINRNINMMLNEKGFVNIGGIMHLYNEAGTFASKTADVSSIERAALSQSATPEVETYLHPEPIASGTRASCNSFTDRDVEVTTAPNPDFKVYFRIFAKAFSTWNGNSWTVKPQVVFAGYSYERLPSWSYGFPGYGGYSPSWIEYSAVHHKEYSLTAKVLRRPIDGGKWASFWHKTTAGPSIESFTIFSVGNQVSGVATSDLPLFIPTVEYSNSLHSHTGMDTGYGLTWATISCAN